ncbi:amidohydrolase family protein [Microbacterium sp. 18062]|uniref:amidohydrolase family protein n=1 Tax=Microbacterium sp. 18062 TaxID=2681410 RepID=UPI00135A6217|nr:amidohydrolase family protein [Microbacterium sp. 18062]
MESLIIGRSVVIGVADGIPDVRQNTALRQVDGVIVEIGDADEQRRAHPSAEIVGSDRHLVTPGFVDSHHHVGLTPLQLGVESESLELWSLMRMVAPNVDPYLDTLVSGIELLKSGVTTVQHLHGRLRADPRTMTGTDAKILSAYEHIGLRASYSVGVTDQNRLFATDEDALVAGLPTPLDSEMAEWLRVRRIPAAAQLENGYTRLREQWHGRAGGRIAIQLAPSNLHWCSDEALELIGELSERDGVPMHIHLLETPYQKSYGRLRSPRGAVGHLDSLGLLNERMTLGHAVHATPTDVAMIAGSGASVCHNPSSNLRLKSGVAPVVRYLEAGVPVALGIDEAGLSDDRDMLLEMKLAYNLHRAPGIGSRVPTVEEVFEMATSNGAATTPFAGTIGTLEVGMAADLVVFDAASIAGAWAHPSLSPLQLVAHRGRPADVDTVMVAGHVVVRGGRVTTLDEADLAREVAASVRIDEQAAASTRVVSEALIRLAREHYAGWLTD